MSLQMLLLIKYAHARNQKRTRTDVFGSFFCDGLTLIDEYNSVWK